MVNQRVEDTKIVMLLLKESIRLNTKTTYGKNELLKFLDDFDNQIHKEKWGFIFLVLCWKLNCINIRKEQEDILENEWRSCK